MSLNIAIIGMGGIFPKARNLHEYWENIVNKVDCITDVPSSRWQIEDYYDPNPTSADKTYCKRGGFMPDVEFDPLEFGLQPNILEVTDVAQLLSLIVAKQALEDAGYGNANETIRKRTGVVLGIGGGQKLITPLTSRLQYPVWEKVLKSSGLSDEDTQKIIEKIKLAYIPWEENSFPGMLGNVISGRIANRLDLGGMNCVVDAACASSLSALRMALSELTEYRSDLMITGGVDTDNSIFMYMCFSKTPAFSKQEQIRPFDANSDGMLIGEAVSMMVLKRLEDAERDGDRIYAVIKGMGAASDGKYKSIYAPRSSGQALALRRAYENANLDPRTVGLIEAHGTGTIVGDPTEFAGLKEVFGENNPRKQHIALGSVKSQIGHTKSAAGAVSTIKVALALHHKILPPTINITQPNPKLQFEESPFYLNTETRPWITAGAETPRRAGVSSFGFGGTNFHIVLEEYNSDRQQAHRLHQTPVSILLHAQTPSQLLARCKTVQFQLASATGEQYYRDLIESGKSLEIPLDAARVGFVAESQAEAAELLQLTIETLKQQQASEYWEHPQGIYYRKTGIDYQGKVVALFAGQGCQYVEMGKELAFNFPQLREAYAQMDSILQQDGLSPISSIVFPPPVFDKKQKNIQFTTLQKTENAQPAIGAFSVGLYKILQQAGFVPNFVAGHSFGELTALWASEVLSDRDYFFLVKARGQAMAVPPAPDFDAGVMLAIKGDIAKIQEVIKNFPGVAVANWNANNQVVLAGKESQIANIRKILDELGYAAILLPVSAAFHTPLVSYAQKSFAQALKEVHLNTAKIPVYSNTTANIYPADRNAIRANLAAQIINPVRFKEEIENIYAAGGTIFVEFGPKNILTNLVKNILEDKPHLAVALNCGQRRAEPRVPKIIMCRVEYGQYQSVELATENISTNGLGFVGIPAEWKIGDSIYVQIENSDFDREEKLYGQIAWRQGKRAGVELNLTSSQTQKLQKIVAQSLQQQQQIKQFDSDRQLRQAVVQLRVAGLPLRDIDPDQIVKATSVPNKKGFTVSLNGNNYVSQKTRNAFEEALKDGHSVVLSKKSDNQLDESDRPVKEIPAIAEELGSSSERIYFATVPDDSQSNSQLINSINHQTETEIMTAARDNSYQQQLLASWERTMMCFQEHQAQSLRAYEEYLRHQTQYSQQFLQVMQQQYALLSGSLVAPSKSMPSVSPTIAPGESDPGNGSVDSHPLTPDNLLSTTIPTDNQSELQLAITRTELPTNQIESLAQSNFELETSPVDINPINTEEEIPNSTIQEFEAGNPELEILSQTLLEVVSEKTGYPVEMLSLEMDMEADLGIDSIKRVEILGAMQEKFPHLPSVNPEELAELRSLGEIVEYMGPKKN